ncbi:MAG: proline racemase family protein [Candidatus Limnocylindrales bacterium]
MESEVGVAQEPIIRHYRGATRTDVEQAYRKEAAEAAQADYLPITHQWTTDWQGFLLAVTFRLSTSSQRRPDAVPSIPMERSAPVTEIAPPRAVSQPSGPPMDQFATHHPAAGQEANGQFAPGDEELQRAPAVTPRRAYQQPAYQQPAYQQPTYQAPPQPVYEQPVYEQPAYQESVYEAPVYQAPAQGQPQATFVEPALQQSPMQQLSTAVGVEPEYGWVQPELQTTPPSMVEAAPMAESPPAAESGVESSPRGGRQTKLTIQTMDLHTAGEPLRIIRSGFPDVPHMPILDRRQWVLDNADYVRRAILQEPRGHKDMYGAILLPPYSDYADIAVLFMHNEGYSTMCGHGIIAITTGLIEEGLFPATEPVTTIRYEVPAGIVAANAATVQLDNGDWAVQGVRFTNVPSYVAAQSLSVRPNGVQLYGSAAQYGALSVDLSFGGAYYGIVNAAELGLRVVPEQADALRRAGAAITEVLRRDHTPAHPTDAALGFVYGTIIVDLDPRSSPDGKATRAHMRNATIFADAELDRSPCGSGTSAILAQLHARGRIRVGQEIINAGITGEHFLGRVEAETSLGSYPAVSTSVAGTAFVTGYSTFTVDSRDPLGEGFLLR